MPDPTGPVASGCAAGSAFTLCGFFYMPWECLVLGAFASSFMCFAIDAIDNKTKSFGSVAITTVAAGIGGPLLATIIVSKFPELVFHYVLLRMACAFAIGLAGPTAIPLLPMFLKRKGGAV